MVQNLSEILHSDQGQKLLSRFIPILACGQVARGELFYNYPYSQRYLRLWWPG